MWLGVYGPSRNIWYLRTVPDVCPPDSYYKSLITNHGRKCDRRGKLTDLPLDLNSKINWNFCQQNFEKKNQLAKMVQVVSSDDDDVVKVTRTKIKEGKKKSQVRDERTMLTGVTSIVRYDSYPSYGHLMIKSWSLEEAKDTNDNDYDEWIPPLRIDNIWPLGVWYMRR